MKLFNVWLFISLCIGMSTPVWAADTSQETNTYQSSFGDYKPLSEDNLSDWKSINTPANKGGHAGHSMAGMQHNMTPEQMANMSDKNMPDMKGMDHSNMAGMDHSQMKHDHAMAPMAEMDHSKMAGMEHDTMKSMPDKKSTAQPMKKEAMPEMDHNAMAGHDHGGSDIKAMDHSQMTEAKQDEMPSSDEAAEEDESKPHEHGTNQAAEHAGMAMPAVTVPTQTSPWQIIPNFHPLVVHFPIALTIIAFLLSLAAYVRPNHPSAVQLAAAGRFTLWIAALGAATAVLFGWLAYNSVNHDDAGHAAMLLHRSWAVPTAIGLILLASWDAWRHRISQLMPVPMLFVLFLLAQSIAVTAWLGGEVVYRHGIGVLSLPASQAAGHSHHHGGTETTGHSHGEKAAEPEAADGHHHEAEKGETHEH